MKETEVLIPEVEDFGIRIDKFLSERVDLTRSALQKLIENGMVTISGKPINKNHIIKTGDIIYVNIPEPEFSSIEPEDISLNIIYEDSAIIVVNKQKGMVVHPAPGNYSGTLVNALLYHCGGSLSGINGVIRPGIVHRIDKDTSGLLIVAKTDAAHVNLALQIQAHTFERIYHAVVIGNLKNDSGTINAPIGRHKTDRKKMAVTTDGRSAVTHYKVIERFNKFTYVELKLETGR
ncbi:MAG: RluA family pseudouridine synthase, partial [Oscillospiraceae bacterium]|nr:RluA family pseudouridine synthase [Oscillospiraceae bacterium]